MSKPQSSELSFEEVMDRLEEIVSAMEGDRMPLEEMVGAYEEGAGLLKVCRARIDSARQRVEVITQKTNSPDLSLSPFQETEETEAAIPTTKATAPPSRTATTSRRKAAPSHDDDDIRLF
jgi:exodeoxyribonuclease VII small subunit